MSVKKYFKLMIDKGASDMFYRAGSNVRMRIDGQVIPVSEEVITLD